MTESLSAVELAWQRQSVWSQLADRLKAGPSKARTGILVLTVAVSALSVAGSQLAPRHHDIGVAVAVAAALVAAGLAALQARQSPDAVRKWTRARSVSEALKTEVYLYLCKVGRYEGADADAQLSAETARLEGGAADLMASVQAAGLTPKERPVPVISGIDDYIGTRVRTSQINNYYLPRAAEITNKLNLLKGVQVGFSALAAALAALASLSGDIAAWAAVSTAVSTAVVAFVASERLEFLLVEYTRTAAELGRLANLRTTPDGAALPDSALIEACEDVISVQNQGWMAKWGS